MIEKIEAWKVGIHLFTTEEEAEVYDKKERIRQELYPIIGDVRMLNLTTMDVIDRLTWNKQTVIEILK